MENRNSFGSAIQLSLCNFVAKIELLIQMNSQKVLFILISVFFLFACNKKEIDILPPTIRVLDWSKQPTAAEVCGFMEEKVFFLSNEDIFEIELEITDDSELAQLKIDIHDNFDCHGHRSSTSTWFKQQIVSLNGSVFREKIRIEIPENPTVGFYHFGLLASDQSGNVSERNHWYTIFLRNASDTIAPQLRIQQPISTELSIRRGQIFTIEAELSDNRALNLGGNAGVQLRYKGNNSSNVFRAAEIDLSGKQVTNTVFTLNWTVPLSLLPGSYELFLSGFDGVRNPAAAQTFILNVLP
jgi:hypothetical protein